MTTVRIVLIFFPSHLTSSIVGFLDYNLSIGKGHDGVRNAYLQPLDGCFMGFEIIFVFLVVTLLITFLVL